MINKQELTITQQQQSLAQEAASRQREVEEGMQVGREGGRKGGKEGAKSETDQDHFSQSTRTPTPTHPHTHTQALHSRIQAIDEKVRPPSSLLPSFSSFF
jgi:flagellar biosynthesis/type III secretory pathway protein FliH